MSVIIPTHDRRAFVREAIASVFAQTQSQIAELIVVDDGSTDGTVEALRAEFATRLRLVATPNRGVSAARNAGALAARGEWLAFLDSDDLWQPRKLAAQLAYLAAHPDRLICHTDEIWIRNGMRVNSRRHHAKPDGDVFAASLERCLVGASSVILRRDLFLGEGGFDETLPACEDYDLWLRLARTTPFGLVAEPLVVKRGGHSDQLSRRYWGMDRFRVAALRKLLAGALTAAQRAAVSDVLRRKCAVLAAGAARRGRPEDAAAYLAMETHA